jgi:hypothetical protein
MTVEACVALAKAGSWRYAGVEYSRYEPDPADPADTCLDLVPISRLWQIPSRLYLLIL